MRQNLALVLGIQGKYDEATQVGSLDLPADRAQENTELLKKIVKLDPKPSGAPTLPTSAWETQVAEAPAAPAPQRMKPATVETGTNREPKAAKMATSSDALFKPSAQ